MTGCRTSADADFLVGRFARPQAGDVIGIDAEPTIRGLLGEPGETGLARTRGIGQLPLDILQRALDRERITADEPDLRVVHPPSVCPKARATHCGVRLA